MTFPQAFCLFYLLLLSLTSQAQIKKAYKLIKKGNYEDAITAFEVDIFNKKGNIGVEAEHNLAKIYFNKNFENYNLEKAYSYAKSSLSRQGKLKGKFLHRAQKSGFGKLMLENHKRRILNEAYAQAKKKDSYKAYQYFLDTYDGPTPIQLEKVTIWRNQRGFKEVKGKDKYQTYENFRNKYLEELQTYTPQTDSLLQMKLFESFMRENGWKQYKKFAYKYPNNVYVKDSIAATAFYEIALSENIKDFKDFIIGYPNSVFKNLAIQNIYKITMKGDDLGDYDYFIRSYPYSKQVNGLWKRYLSLYIEKEGPKALSQFKANYPSAPIQIFQK